MFENLGTALIQLLGFLGVFGFFIFQLLKDNKNDGSFLKNNNIKQNKNTKKDIPTKKGLFRRQTKTTDEVVTPKRGWFK
tara:strand:+ start:215 stop:451 length:237 start_codon:yes stop_codon:yes gene_type:complete